MADAAGSRKTALRAGWARAPNPGVRALALLLLPELQSRRRRPGQREERKRRKKRRKGRSSANARDGGDGLSVLMAAQVMACAASITATADTHGEDCAWTLWMTVAQRCAENVGMIAMTKSMT